MKRILLFAIILLAALVFWYYKTYPLTPTVTINGTTFGPQITIYTDDQAGREDGIPSPHDLDGLKLTAAVKFVEATNDAEALKRWQKIDKRAEVKAACAAKLGV